jgi:hypothetical protein
MSTPITDRAAQVLREIDAALALAEKATQGPWIAEDSWVGKDNSAVATTCHYAHDADAAFIAASRTLLPASLQIIRDDIKAWLELRDSLKVGRDDVTTWDFCNRRLTAICDQWRAAK